MVKENINWRDGTLKKFESMTCFGAKFCYLNKVKPKDFVDFISEFKSSSINVFSSSTTRPPIYSLYDSLNINPFSLARALKEPVDIVRSLSLLPLIPDFDHFRGERAHLYIQYCPICLSYGYHSIFHQLPWLNLCLTHRIPLLQHSNGNCKNSSFIDGSANYIKNFYTLLFSKNSFWNFNSSKAWESESHKYHSKQLNKYVNWLKRPEIKNLGLKSNSIFYFDFLEDCCSREQRVSDFLQISDFFNNRKSGFSFALLPSKIRSKRVIFSFEAADVDCLFRTDEKTLLTFTDFCVFLKLRRFEVEVANEMPTWKINVINTVSDMRQHHEVCIESLAKIIENEYFNKLATDLHNSNEICPRLSLLSIFMNEWEILSFDMNEFSVFYDRFRAENSFYADQYQKNGITSLASTKIEVKDQNGLMKIYEVKYWKLCPLWQNIADLVLEQFVSASAWELFEKEQNFKNTKELTRNFYHILRISFPVVLLEISRAGFIELTIWRRIPSHLPNWGTLNKRPLEHALNIKKYENNYFMNTKWEEDIITRMQNSLTSFGSLYHKR